MQSIPCLLLVFQPLPVANKIMKIARRVVGHVKHETKRIKSGVKLPSKLFMAALKRFPALPGKVNPTRAPMQLTTHRSLAPPLYFVYHRHTRNPDDPGSVQCALNIRQAITSVSASITRDGLLTAWLLKISCKIIIIKCSNGFVHPTRLSVYHPAAYTHFPFNTKQVQQTMLMLPQ